MDEEVLKRWAEFLNPDVVRTKFTTLGLYMVAHEMLTQAITRRPHEFFSDRWTKEKGWLISDRYRDEVLALDPKGKGDPLRGSLAWLQKNDVIDASDVATHRELTEARNEVAHELAQIMSGRQMPDLPGLLPRLIALVSKIERWWIVNVDIATDPDYDGADIDEDAIISGSQWMLHMLSRVALGEEEEAWEYYRGFMEQAAKTKQ